MQPSPAYSSQPLENHWIEETSYDTDRIWICRLETKITKMSDSVGSKISEADIVEVVNKAGIKPEDDIQRVAGSIVVNLINLSIQERGAVNLEFPALINSIQFGCQLRKRRIRRVMACLERKVQDRKKRYPKVPRFDFIGKGFFEVFENQVKFTAGVLGKR